MYTSAAVIERPKSLDDSCPVCRGSDLREVLRTRPLPIDNNRLFRTAQDARMAARAPLDLVGCARCGHLFNRSHDDGLVDYGADYENSQIFSPRFRAYAEELAADLVQRYALRRRHVVEIGGGRGDFLALLCAAGENTGTNFTPSYHPEPGAETPAGVTFVADYYTDKYASLPADLIVCRHVIEHLDRPHEFVAAIRKALGDNRTPVYVETPNAAFMVAAGTPWDIIFPHVSYFTAHSLATLFVEAGFEVLRCDERFDGQFLAIELRGTPASERAGKLPDSGCRELGALVAFGAQATAALECWRRAIEAEQTSGRCVALWGAGAKGITFLNTVQADHVAYVVDVSPRKHGFFTAGTGHRIVQPAHVALEPPDLVIMLNAAYRDEVAASLAQLAPRAALTLA